MSAAKPQELKPAVKEAIKEAMVENSETLKDLLVEVIEDVALLQRMEEGRQTELVSRDEVMGLLEPKH
jgi:hypothetical protein